MTLGRVGLEAQEADPMAAGLGRQIVDLFMQLRLQGFVLAEDRGVVTVVPEP